MTIEERLDHYLSIFKTTFPSEFINEVNQKIDLRELIQKDKDYNALIKQLKDIDGLIYENEILNPDKSYSTIKYFEATVKGLIFEGYVQKKKDTERIRKRDNLNIWAVTLGGAGALIAGLYALFQIATKIFYLFCNCH